MAAPALRPDHLGLLTTFPLFAALSPHLLDEFLDGATSVRVPAESDLFSVGQVLDYLYVLIEGEVGLTVALESGEATLIEILGPGATFMEAAVMADLPTLVGAKTLRASTLLCLPAAKVRDDVARSPQLAAAMVRSLSAHFRLMVNEIKDLKLKSAGQRLGLYLLELADGNGSARVVLPHSKGVIAARIGIRRETLSRVFAALSALGVTAKGHAVTITDIARLREFCGR